MRASSTVGGAVGTGNGNPVVQTEGGGAGEKLVKSPRPLYTPFPPLKGGTSFGRLAGLSGDSQGFCAGSVYFRVYGGVDLRCATWGAVNDRWEGFKLVFRWEAREVGERPVGEEVFEGSASSSGGFAEGDEGGGVCVLPLKAKAF